MLTIIIYGVIFFIFGYVVKIKLDSKLLKLEEDFYSKLKNFNFQLIENQTNRERSSPKLFLLQSEVIKIPANLSNALQEIFDYIILKYINSWYTGFSNNEDFIVEIKYFFHVLFAELLVRLSKVDAVSILRERLLPIIMSHLDLCRQIQHSALPDDAERSAATTAGNENAALMQDACLRRMRGHLHVALLSRSQEVQYLRRLAGHLVVALAPDYVHLNRSRVCSHFLEESLISTVLLPGMDSIASPDFINKLICVCLQAENGTTSSTSGMGETLTSVPVLYRYQQAWLQKLQNQKNHPKGVELFLRDEKYFYHFLQYIKFINAVSPINLFKQMDSITLKLTTPQLGEKACIGVHEDLQQLVNFLSSNSNQSSLQRQDLSHLSVGPELLSRIQDILADGASQISQLVTCSIWMENYHKLHRHICEVYLPQYMESEQYLSTIYRDKLEQQRSGDDSSTDLNDKRLDFSSAKFGSTLKNSSSYHSADDLLDLDGGGSGGEDAIDARRGNQRQDLWLLSMWRELPDVSKLRVRIPSISQRKADRVELNFTICTYKVDSEESISRVYRKYVDFYILEQKLVEFHGNMGKSLSGRKIFEMKKLDYLDKCKLEFETYLMFLINRPFLKNSQLLYSFLTDDDVEFSGSNFTDLNISRFMKSVPLKLAAKKGQFLETFLANFHVSCQQPTAPAAPSSSSSGDQKTVAKPNAKLNSSINNRMNLKQFWNNASILTVSPETQIVEPCSMSSRFVFCFYDAAVHLMESVLNGVGPLCRAVPMLMGAVYRLRPALLGAVDALVDRQLRQLIRVCVWQEGGKMAVALVHLLRDTILITGISRSTAEKLERRSEAQKAIRDLLPNFLVEHILPTEAVTKIHEELDCLFNILQHPKLNKQLTYLLLDAVLSELFPDLTSDPS